MRKLGIAALGITVAATLLLAFRRRGGRIGVPGASEPKPAPLTSALLDWAGVIRSEIDFGRIRADVLALPAPRNRMHWPEAMSQAEDLILRGFRQAGWTAAAHTYTLTNVEGYEDAGNKATTYPRLEGANIVATKEGEASSDAVVVLAHYDTIRDSPGANDNTASVACLLELARVLAPYRFDKTVLLAVTDMEEIGFLGARELVPKLTQERRILGVLNLETMAYTSSEPDTQALPPGLDLIYPVQIGRMRDRQFRGDFTAILYNGKGARLAATFAAALAHVAGAHVPIMVRDPKDLPVLGGLLKRTVPSVRHFSRSDHVPFWEAGIAAIQITDTGDFRYEHYHKPTDTSEKLDYGRLADIVGATAITLAQVAGLTSDAAVL